MLFHPPAQPNRSPFLAPTSWVDDNISVLRLLDGTYAGDATQVYLNIHPPGAQRFDIDVIKDDTNPLPHMLPQPAQMSAHLSQLGLHPDDSVVIYDQQGLFGAARVWWMLRAYGFENVFIIEGGLPRWYEEERAVESGNEMRPSRSVAVKLRAERLATKADVQQATLSDVQIVDARAAARYSGHAPEPRAGMRSGHMPSAINLPYTELMEGDTLKNLDELRAVIAAAGIDVEKPLISSCGSGVTAAFLCLALESLGISKWSLYDGSWSEWSSSPECAVVKAA